MTSQMSTMSDDMTTQCHQGFFSDDVMHATLNETLYQPNMSLSTDKIVLAYLLPVVILIGTVGNVMSGAVLVRPRMRTTSVYFYLLALSIADTAVLYVSAAKTWVRIVTGYELMHASNVTCKLVVFVLLVSQWTSAWLLVITAVDRFVAVWFPFKAASISNLSRARIATGVLIFLVLVSNIHVFWTFHLRQSREALGRTQLTCQGDAAYPFVNGPFEYIKLGAYCAVPFIIILTLNLAIIVRLRAATAAAANATAAATAAAAKLRNRYHVNHINSDFVSTGDSGMDFDCEDDEDTEKPDVICSKDSSRCNRIVTGVFDVHDVARHNCSRTTSGECRTKYGLEAGACGYSGSGMLSTRSGFSGIPRGGGQKCSGPRPRGIPLRGVGAFADGGAVWAESRACLRGSKVGEGMGGGAGGGGVGGGGGMGEAAKMQMKRQAHVTSMLLVVSFTWLVLTIPFTLYGILVNDHKKFIHLKTICFLLMYTNHAVNFYLYCVSGRKFRRELGQLCRCCRRRRWSPKSGDTGGHRMTAVDCCKRQPRRDDIEPHPRPVVDSTPSVRTGAGLQLITNIVELEMSEHRN